MSKLSEFINDREVIIEKKPRNFSYRHWLYSNKYNLLNVSKERGINDLFKDEK